MKHVSILIPQGHSSLSNIEGTHHILSEVNSFRQGMGLEPLFKVQLVGLARANTQRNGLFTVSPDLLIGEVEKTHLIIIPALFGDVRSAVADNEAFLEWIREQYAAGAEIASFCLGAFFLAATGLLNGKTCTTHWRFANEFRNMYPEVDLLDDRIMTEAGGIYTSGGAYSYLNLLLYLVEKNAGRDMAILIAKAFMIDIERHSQSPFIMFSGQKDHNDDAVIRAPEFIEPNYTERITVDELLSGAALSRRNFERRFKKATANTVVEYIQRVKIEVAKKNLESTRMNINEVMYGVGYSDVKAFREVFKKITGMSPIDYRNKYNKEAVTL